MPEVAGLKATTHFIIYLVVFLSLWKTRDCLLLEGWGGVDSSHQFKNPK